MTKDAERNYPLRMNDGGRRHSLEKPFSDDLCPVNLIGIGGVMALLPPPPARLLDFGCGAGWTSVFFAKRGYDVTGLDISPGMLELAEQNRAANAPGTRLRFLCADYENPPPLSGFDCAVFFDCLHHADSERAALQAAFNALQPGGWLITHEPGEGHAAAPGSLAAVAEFGVNERDMPPHLIIRTAREIGFVDPQIFPYAGQILAVFYRESQNPGGFLRRLRAARNIARRMTMNAEHASGMVRMRKPAA